MKLKPMQPAVLYTELPLWMQPPRDTSQQESKRCRDVYLDWLLFCFIRHVDIASPRNNSALRDLLPLHTPQDPTP
jgi:hypothetical protein